MQTLSNFSPHIEVYSIDECFLNLGEMKDLAMLGRQMKYTVQKCTNIPVGVGIAPSKALAKIANHMAKKHRSFNGVCIIESDKDREEALRLIPIGEVWGIGSRHTKRLLELGIHTAAHFVKMNDHWIKNT